MATFQINTKLDICWELPPLNTVRSSHGSVLLKSMRVFYFCGAVGPGIRFNSIESLEAEREWKTLPLNEKITKLSTWPQHNTEIRSSYLEEALMRAALHTS